MRRRLRLTRRDEHEAAAARLHEVRRERLGRVLDGSHEERAQEVPVLERRILDRRAATPAADEVDEPVDAAVVPRRERRRPCPRRLEVEEVDDVGLDRRADLGGELVEPFPVAPAHAWERASVCKAADDRRAEVARAAGDGDHPPVQNPWHAARLAMRPRDE